MFANIRARRAQDATTDGHGRRVPCCLRCYRATVKCVCDDTDLWEDDTPNA